MEAPHHRFYIDGWLIDSRLHRIFGDGETVLIEPKVMQVLTCLAAHPGEVLDRDALLDEVWGDTVVTDHVLTRSISELRKVFGDDARHPSVIETIPKTGYRLIASVTADDGGFNTSMRGDSARSTPSEVTVSPSFVSERAIPTPTASSTPHRLSVSLGIVVLAIVVSAWLILKPERTIQPLQTTLLTSLPGVETSPLFSPDGQRVAYLWRVDNTEPQQLFVKLPGEETHLQLTDGATSVYSATWSPDGTRLAFRRNGRDECGIYVVSALGGPERKLSDCTASQFSLAWSPDGTGLAASYADSTGRGLVLIDPETEATRRRTAVEGRGYHYQPVFSPDGTHLAYLQAVHPGMDDIFVIPVAGNALPRQLTADRRHIAGLTWKADGKHLVYSSNRAGNYKLWQIPASGGDPVWMAEVGAYDPGAVSIAPDGQMVYAEWDYEINIWRTALDAQDVASSAPEQWIASTRWDVHPRYSPDGSRIAFTSNRIGSPNLWVSSADGSQPMQLTRFEHAFIGLPSWSPDGRRLAFDARLDEHSALYVVDADGGTPRRLTAETQDIHNPTWSRDGKWIYYASLLEDDWQLWKHPTENGIPQQVTQDGGYFGMESEDGKMLYFTIYGENGLWQMPTTRGEALLIYPGLQASQWGNWTIGPDGIYFVDSQPSPPVLHRFNPSTGITSDVLTLPPSVLGHYPGLSLSPDRKWLLFASADRVESDLVLVSPPMVSKGRRLYSAPRNGCGKVVCL